MHAFDLARPRMVVLWLGVSNVRANPQRMLKHSVFFSHWHRGCHTRSEMLVNNLSHPCRTQYTHSRFHTIPDNAWHSYICATIATYICIYMIVNINFCLESILNPLYSIFRMKRQYQCFMMSLLWVKWLLKLMHKRSDINENFPSLSTKQEP